VARRTGELRCVARKAKRALPLLAVLLAASCSPSTERAPGETADSLATSLSPRAPAVAVAEEPDQLVPFLARRPASGAIWRWILPSLIRIESDSGGQIRFVGDLATSWQIEDGGRSAGFLLDEGRIWEDTTAVDVADVVGTYQLYRSREIAGGWADRVREIVQVRPDVTSGAGVLFQFDRPLSSQRILQLASLPLISIDQWTATRGRRPALGSAGRPVLSAGPFRVGEWTPGDFLSLERHPSPPPARVPAAERVVLRFIPSARGRAMQFELGAVQLAIDLPAEEVIRLRESPRDRCLHSVKAARMEILVWNLEDDSWGLLENRRAIRSALEMGKLQKAYCEETVSACPRPLRFIDFLSPGGADPWVDDAVYEGDTTLPAAPAEDLTPLGLLYVAADAARERVAVEIAMQLHRAGVECILGPVTAEECLSMIRQRAFQAVLIGYDLPPIPDLGEIFGSDGVYNVAGLRDPTVDELIAEARSAASDTIPDLWQRVERRVGELLPCLPVACSFRTDGADPRLEDYRPDPLEPYGNLLGVR
jgi:ABC-type transport system substrate-binding protein